MKDKYGNYKKTLTYGDFDKANPLYEATLSNFDQSSYREIEDKYRCKLDYLRRSSN